VTFVTEKEERDRAKEAAHDYLVSEGEEGEGKNGDFYVNGRKEKTTKKKFTPHPKSRKEEKKKGFFSARGRGKDKPLPSFAFFARQGEKKRGTHLLRWGSGTGKNAIAKRKSIEPSLKDTKKREGFLANGKKGPT